MVPLLPITPLSQAPHAVARVPGSKSMTNRALILACHGSKRASGVRVVNALDCEDTRVMADSLARLGFQIDAAWDDARPCLTVRLPSGQEFFPNKRGQLDVANSGTSMRFLTALACLGQGRYRIDGVPRMRERPIEDLLAALRQLGADARSEMDNGCPPVIVNARGLDGGLTRVKGAISSQFLSALLMAAPLAKNAVTIEVDGPLVSGPYVTMTLAMMRAIGLQVDAKPGPRFVIAPGQQARPVDIVVEPDASAASYFFAAAAITGGQVTVSDLTTASLQGDIRFVDILEKMGCRVDRSPNGITVHGGPLHGVDVDMNEISDTVMTLGAVACFATGPTTICNVAHIRHKETDRLAALATELRRIGAGAMEFTDGLTITPAPLRGATIETYKDHRMAMSLALVGLKVPGIVIDNPGCVGKTYPRFFEDLEKLR